MLIVMDNYVTQNWVVWEGQKHGVRFSFSARRMWNGMWEAISTINEENSEYKSPISIDQVHEFLENFKREVNQ